jgi:hypothetical protein
MQYNINIQFVVNIVAKNYDYHIIDRKYCRLIFKNSMISYEIFKYNMEKITWKQNQCLRNAELEIINSHINDCKLLVEALSGPYINESMANSERKALAKLTEEEVKKQDIIDKHANEYKKFKVMRNKIKKLRDDIVNLN